MNLNLVSPQSHPELTTLPAQMQRPSYLASRTHHTAAHIPSSVTPRRLREPLLLDKATVRVLHSCVQLALLRSHLPDQPRHSRIALTKNRGYLEPSVVQHAHHSVMHVTVLHTQRLPLLRQAPRNTVSEHND